MIFSQSAQTATMALQTEVIGSMLNSHLMITGGLVNIVPVKHRNQFTKWRHVLATPYGAVGYAVVHHETTSVFEDHRIIGRADPHDDLWLYVIHGEREYIGCFRADSFTPEHIAATAADFACTTISH